MSKFKFKVGQRVRIDPLHWKPTGLNSAGVIQARYCNKDSHNPGYIVLHDLSFPDPFLSGFQRNNLVWSEHVLVKL